MHLGSSRGLCTWAVCEAFTNLLAATKKVPAPRPAVCSPKVAFNPANSGSWKVGSHSTGPYDVSQPYAEGQRWVAQPARHP